MHVQTQQLSLAARLWIFCSLILVLASVFSFFVAQMIEQRMTAEFLVESRNHIQTASSDLGSPLWLHQHSYVQDILERSSLLPTVHAIHLFSTESKKNYDLGSSSIYTRLQQFRRSPQLEQVLDDLLLIRHPVIFNNEPLGEIIVAYDRSNLNMQLASIRMKVLLVLAGFCLLTVLITLLLSRSLLQSFDSLQEYFQGIVSRIEGEETDNISVSLTREFTPIVTSAGKLADDISGRLDDFSTNHGFLETLFSQSPIAIIIADLNGRIVQSNRAAAELFEEESLQIEQANLEALIGSSDYFNIKNHLFKSEGRLTGYVSFVLIRGERRKVIELNASLISRDAENSHIVFTLVDVTDKLDTQHEILENQSKVLHINHDLAQTTQQLRKANDRSEVYARKLAELIKIYSTIARCSRNEDVLELVAREGARLVGAKKSSVFLHHAAESKLSPVISWPKPALRQSLSLSEQDSPIVKSFREQQPFFLKEVPVSQFEMLGFQPKQRMCMIAVPVGDHDYRYGVAIYFSPVPDMFSVEDMHLATTLTHQAALMLKKISLMQAFKEKANSLEKSNEDLKRSQHQLFQLQKIESLGTLVGGIAHDYNNLMGIINPNLDLLRLNAGDERETIKRLDIIEKAAGRATELTRQLLTFSNPGVMDLKPMALNSLIRQVMDVYRHSLDEQIHVVLELEPDLPNIQGDSTYLSQALLNLAENAREAMPEAGILRIRSQLQTYAPSGESQEVPKPYVKITVSDTGSGIANDNLYNIFDPFFSTKSGGKTSGLGLSVTYGIIKSHNGYIAVETKENEGSAFHIFLPPTEEPVAEKIDIEEVDGFAVGNETILVVDDEDMIRDSLRDLLGFLGYKVHVAESGSEALKKISNGDEFDAAIIDFAMPQMDGLQTIQAIREQRPDIKIVLSTGYSDKEKLVQDSVRVEGYLPKPYHLGNLAEMMSRILKNGEG